MSVFKGSSSQESGSTAGSSIAGSSATSSREPVPAQPLTTEWRKQRDPTIFFLEKLPETNKAIELIKKLLQEINNISSMMFKLRDHNSQLFSEKEEEKKSIDMFPKKAKDDDLIKLDYKNSGQMLWKYIIYLRTMKRNADLIKRYEIMVNSLQEVIQMFRWNYKCTPCQFFTFVLSWAL